MYSLKELKIMLYSRLIEINTDQLKDTDINILYELSKDEEVKSILKI